VLTTSIIITYTRFFVKHSHGESAKTDRLLDNLDRFIKIEIVNNIVGKGVNYEQTTKGRGLFNPNMSTLPVRQAVSGQEGHPVH
jgi:N-acetylglutamate synthase/N-acetylornithine aminotransferase